MSLDRRAFLRLMGAGALSGVLHESIARALSIPANSRTGTIADVQHIVVLMQENRSFDHYFGTLRGVRGFGDPRAVDCADGHSVFSQADGAGVRVFPFRPAAADLGLQFLQDLAHDWTTTHDAWNEGRYDRWVAAKTPLTMAHLARDDIPYHYALADAFTVCDAYHCSLLGPTDPNRFHLFSGWVGNDGVGGGPAVDNSDANYSWSTFPEALEQAGISWKVYQDVGLGLDADNEWGQTKDAYIGTYGDNSLLLFEQYRRASPGSALHAKARTGTRVSSGGSLFDHFRQDAARGVLPQVSWLVTPEAYSEHPNWPPNYGAFYISQVMDALTANPDVWSGTVLFIVYDENDGLFDHAVPPVPPMSTAHGSSNVSITHELYAGMGDVPAGPYGLGPRVPMLVISPWSKGGWVDSEVFDHTSLLRFMQKRFSTEQAPLPTPNITDWRRAVCGDLTSAFDFSKPDLGAVLLPSAAAYRPPDRERHADYQPSLPSIPAMPRQESGVRPARAVPYSLNVDAALNASARDLSLTFINSGSRAAVFHVRDSSAEPPRSYTVAAGSQLSGSWRSPHSFGSDIYDLRVHGPNGFFRKLAGRWDSPQAANLIVCVSYEAARNAVLLSATNRGKARCSVKVTASYEGGTQRWRLPPGGTRQQFFELSASYGWYDFIVWTDEAAFSRQLAGHLENGRDTMSDPAIALKPPTIT